MKNKKDFFDILPPEAIKAVDAHGYGFLAEHGYNVEGASDSRKARRRLKAELRANSQTLVYSTVAGKNKGTIILFFSLKATSGEMVARSKGIKLVFQQEERDG